MIFITFSGDAKRALLLHECIQKLSTDWWRHIDNVWLVVSDHSVEQLAALLSSIISKDEKLLVAEIDIIKAQGLLPDNAWEWINEKIKKP